MISLNLLDWALLIIFFTSIFLGFYKGLIREIFALGFLILGFSLAYRFYPDLSRYLNRWVSNRVYSDFLAFVLIFCFIIMIGLLVSWVVKKTLIRGPLLPIDRLLGGIMGAVRGFLLGIVIVAAFGCIPNGRGWMRGSKLTPMFQASIRLGGFLFPDKFKKLEQGMKNDDKQENFRDRRAI